MRTVTLTHGQDEFRFRIPSEHDWDALADYVIGKMKPGDVIALSGPLGAGKTTFVQALAKKLGIKKVPQSPTFALMRSYALPKKGPVRRLLHVDAYRIESERELLALDLDEELADGKTVLVVEWPEKMQGWIGAQKQVFSIVIKTKEKPRA